MREIFGEDLLYYQFLKLDQINGRLKSLDEKKRIEMVMHGQKKVLEDHTWDSRVEFALKVLDFIKI